MTRGLFVCLVVWASNFAVAQKDYVDSLHNQLRYSKEDTTRVLLFSELGNYYAFNLFDSGIFYGRKAINLSNNLGYGNGIYLGLKCLFLSYNCQGNYPKALEVTLQNLENGEKIRHETPIAFINSTYCLGLLNREMGNFQIAITQLETSIKLYNNAGLPEAGFFPAYCQLALIYQLLGRYDSALWLAQKGYELGLKPNIWSRVFRLSASVLGSIYTEMGNYEQGKKYLFIGNNEAKRVNNLFFLSWNYNLLANLFKKTKVLDSCIYYARASLSLWGAHNFGNFAVSASALLTTVFDAQNKPDSVIKYMKITLAAKDTVFSQSRVKEFEKFVFDEEKRKQETATREERYKARTKTWAAVSTLIAFLLITLIILRNISLKRKNESNRRALAENELQLQKLEAERTKAELQQQATELEMQALRAQMNPHFIFNCLTSINRFILANESENASDYLTKFSRLIRMVLNNSKNSLISLEDELQMLSLYLDLEKLRFKKSFEYHISFYNQFSSSSIFIPPLLLQPFAENAIWHGLMNKKGQGILDIAFENDEDLLNCYITDNGIGREKAAEINSKSAEKQKSMGMQITAERLALFNKETEQATFRVEDLVDASGQPAGTRVTLKIKYKQNDEF